MDWEGNAGRERQNLFHYIKTLTGIVLDDSKTVFVESGLLSVMTTFECNSYADLILKAPADGRIQQAIIEVVTTHETFFFRDRHYFELIRNKLIPEIFAKKKTLRIWCVACSTGQEPYSIAILLREMFGHLYKYDIQIIATDISQIVLEKAQEARYSNFELSRGISDVQRALHFETKDPKFYNWQLKIEIRNMVTFRHLNLLRVGNLDQRFDLILCRNVVCYFSDPERRLLFAKIARHLNPQGTLIVGSSESVAPTVDVFTRHVEDKTSYYTLENGKH